MKVCVQAIWENVATKVKLLCVMCKLSCKVCSQESCSLELECKAGGKFHMKTIRRISSLVSNACGLRQVGLNTINNCLSIETMTSSCENLKYILSDR